MVESTTETLERGPPRQARGVCDFEMNAEDPISGNLLESLLAAAKIGRAKVVAASYHKGMLRVGFDREVSQQVVADLLAASMKSPEHMGHDLGLARGDGHHILVCTTCGTILPGA